jgi:hypothetical protein
MVDYQRPFSNHLAEIAYCDNFIGFRASHAIADGGSIVHLVETLGTDVPGFVEPNCLGILELFEKDIKNSAAKTAIPQTSEPLFLLPSHHLPGASTMRATGTELRIPLQSIRAFAGKVAKMSEHTWAAMLLSATLHNARISGKLQLPPPGVEMTADMRRYAAAPRWEMGCLFSVLAPSSGPFAFETPLFEITSGLRRNLEAQRASGAHFRVAGGFARSPPPPPPADVRSVRLCLSSLGAMRLHRPVVDFRIWNDQFGGFMNTASLLGMYSVESEDRKELAILQLINEGRISLEHSKRILEDAAKSFQNVSLEMTFIEALRKICPAV